MNPHHHSPRPPGRWHLSLVVVPCFLLSAAQAETPAAVARSSKADKGAEVTLPEGSRIDANGRIVDKLDYPFVDDPRAIGRWKSVGFVEAINEFDAGSPEPTEELFLKGMVFLNGGKTSLAGNTWTRGMVLDSAERIASKYIIKEIGGTTYMFFEWKSGDYIVRHQKPWYYVLKKVPSDAGQPGKETDTAGAPPDLNAKASFPEINRRPSAATWTRPRLSELSRRDTTKRGDNPWSLDLRQSDVSRLDLHDRLDDLLFASFDEGTRWPEPARMPAEYDRKKIRELGTNPGLGLRKLHAQGITGKGIGVAIIDQTLLTEHVEYKDRLRLYEEFLGETESNPEASMHGGAVASIAVGKTAGVAPGADLYYIASSFGTMQGRDFTQVARSIRRILAINEQLPTDRKIRVISISVGWTPKEAGYEAVVAAARQAKDAGLLLICSSVEKVHGLKFHGLGRQPLADPDRFESFEPGLWWLGEFAKQPESAIAGRLLVPMDSRTTASPQGPTQYVFYRDGGWSWSIPYIAGLYALAAQVDPGITPDRFWATAMKTGKTIQLEAGGKKHPFGPIIDPAGMIAALRRERR